MEFEALSLSGYGDMAEEANVRVHVRVHVPYREGASDGATTNRPLQGRPLHHSSTVSWALEKDKASDEQV